jgi:hypothetical protein
MLYPYWRENSVFQYQTELQTVAVLKISVDYVLFIWQQQFISILKVDHGKLPSFGLFFWDTLNVA